VRKSCSIEGCDRPVYGHGWCTKHWGRWYRHGDPLYVTPGRAHRSESVEVRFWAKVNRDGPIPEYAPDLGPCWIWTAGLSGRGYGQFSGAAGRVKAHRWAYENEHGPVPDGLDLDHLCHVPACVRPSHLEPVTRSENLRRGYAAMASLGQARERPTHCKRGHEFTAENTRIDKRGCRCCRACARILATESYHRLKEVSV
jgi:hypothetical protein